MSRCQKGESSNPPHTDTHSTHVKENSLRTERNSEARNGEHCRLFRAEPHYQHPRAMILRTLNDNMRKFNCVASYLEEKALDHMEVFKSWKQTYFQLPGSVFEDGDDDTSMHLVLVRVQDNQLEFVWATPPSSLSHASIPAGLPNFRCA